MKFKNIPSFTNSGNYRITVPWNHLEEQLNHYNDAQLYKMEMNPDFQRGHVWTESQQRKYVEYILRGGNSSKEIYWNCNGWMGSFKGPMYLVDGKQRLEAVRKFLRNELAIFDGNYLKNFEDKIPLDAIFNFNINNLKTRKEVIQWYLDLNEGGTPHTDEELERVKSLLVLEK